MTRSSVRISMMILALLFAAACGSPPLALPEAGQNGKAGPPGLEATATPEREEIPTPTAEAVLAHATPSSDFPFSSAEEIKVGEMIDLEEQFLEQFRQGKISLTDETAQPLDVGFAGWSPDGKYILLTVWQGEIQEFPYQDGTGKEGVYRLSIRHLWKANIDGSEPQELAPNAVLPQWSPDGQWIAFLTDALIDGYYNHELWVISTDGQNRYLLANGVREYSWLDNNHLIFIKGTFHGERFWKIGITNRQIQPLEIVGTEGNRLNAPNVSPDAKYIAFSNITPENKPELWIGIVENNFISIRARVPQSDIAHISWSPDSNLLAVGMFSKPFQILKTDGTKVATVTQVAGNTPASWAPNSRIFTFASEGQLFVANSDGSNIKQLIKLKDSRANQPIWSPNGTAIGFNYKNHTGAAILTLE